LNSPAPSAPMRSFEAPPNDRRPMRSRPHKSRTCRRSGMVLASGASSGDSSSSKPTGSRAISPRCNALLQCA
jgi:hypothetical protein